MKRRDKQFTQIDAIVIGDPHIRETKPRARMDEYFPAQWDKLKQILALGQKYKCPIICVGDFFDHWKPSPALLNQVLDIFQEFPDVTFLTIYGNHDLPQHNLELSEKSGLATLQKAGVIGILPGTHWGETPFGESNLEIKGRKIAVWHIMTYMAGRLPYPGCEGMSAQGILKRYSKYDAIFTGHNHKPFKAITDDGRLLLNAGSWLRQSVSEEHEPCVWLYDAENNKVFKHVLQHEKNVISREHIDKVEERDERIQAFISKLDTDVEALSLEENLEQIITKNKISKQVKTIIYEAIE